MIEIRESQRARDLVNMIDGVDEVEHPNQTPTTFVELSKTHEARIVLMLNIIVIIISYIGLSGKFAP